MFESNKTRFLTLVLFLYAGSLTAQGGSASADCKSTVTGTLEILPLASKIFGNTRNLRIWLPPSYGEPSNSQKTYPVLYLLDGQMLFDRCTPPGQSAEWRVDETLTDLIHKDAIEPMVVVGIDNTGSTRAYEFAPYQTLCLPGPPACDASAPAGDRFPDFLAGEVLPLINARYRVAKGREHTGIGGSSLGAAAALYAAIHRPDLFGLALLESTSLQLGNGQLIRDTNPILMGPLRVSIGVGTEEIGPEISKALGVPNFDAGFVRLSQTLAANMKAALFNHPEVKLIVETGAQHNARFWGERFPAAVQFLYAPASHR